MSKTGDEMDDKSIVQTFDNPEFGQIRVIKDEGGEPWFVIADLCKALDLSNPTMVANRLNEDDLSTTEVTDSLGRKQKANTTNEGGMYEVVFMSRKPEAHAFKRWVTHEVLPAIRRDGGYMVARDETPEQTMARAVLIAQRTIERQRAQLDEMRPKAFFADAVSQASTSVLVGVLAKLLKQNGYDTGQNRLFKTLCDEGFLIGRRGRNYHMPTQRAAEMGLFEVKESARTHADGHTSIDRTTLVTGKGQVYFINRYCGR